jgi:hypothetical protein
MPPARGKRPRRDLNLLKQFVSPSSASRYVCDHCRRDVTTSVRVRCAECASPEVDLCAACFAVGAEPGAHRADHAYRVEEAMAWPLLTPGWAAAEELLLIEALTMRGIGSWDDVSAHVGSKGPYECANHYYDVYVHSDETRAAAVAEAEAADKGKGKGKDQGKDKGAAAADAADAGDGEEGGEEEGEARRKRAKPNAAAAAAPMEVDNDGESAAGKSSGTAAAGKAFTGKSADDAADQSDAAAKSEPKDKDDQGKDGGDKKENAAEAVLPNVTGTNLPLIEVPVAIVDDNLVTTTVYV